MSQQNVTLLLSSLLMFMASGPASDSLRFVFLSFICETFASLQWQKQNKTERPLEV